MNRLPAGVAFLLLSTATVAQQDPSMTAQQAIDATLNDLRGLRDERTPSPFPPQRYGQAPIEFPTVQLRESSSGTVSVAELLHKVPKAAKKAFDRGVKLARKGDQGHAIDEFKKAVASDPDYDRAHLLLAMLLAAKPETQAEAEYHFSQAQRTITNAEIKQAHGN